MRIGMGYDSHRLVEGRPLKLGGISIPFERGLLGHSDGDALLHALTDALLGAAGAGDIGALFPDTDPAFKDADSALLLDRVCHLVADRGYRVINADMTVIAQAPRIAAYIPAMLQRLSGIIGTDVGNINIKAKTAEGMGPVGREEGIECYAVVLLEYGKE